MRVKVSIEVMADETDSVIALGEIVGSLEINKDKQDAGEPVLTVRMRNILAAVQSTITTDSQA